MRGVKTDLLALPVEVVISVLDGTAGVNADFLVELCSERHMISLCTRKGSSTGTECCQQEQPALAVRKRAFSCRFSDRSFVSCCWVAHNNVVGFIGERLVTSESQRKLALA